MSRTMQQVKAARAVRGRKWDQEAERCATCAHHVNHQYCDLHKTETRDNGGCAMHVSAPSQGSGE